MTYSPLSSTYTTGEAFFEGLGLIGGSTGMTPIFAMNNSLVAPDASQDDLTLLITNSSIRYTFDNPQEMNLTWNLGGTYEKLFAVGYFNACDDGGWICFSENTYTGTPSGDPTSTDAYVTDMYYAGSNGPVGIGYGSEIVKRSGAVQTYTHIINDYTAYNKTYLTTSCVYGVAFYCDTTSGNESQKAYFKYGTTSQWFPIVESSDTDLTSGFQSVGIHVEGVLTAAGRQLAPFYVWGA